MLGGVQHARPCGLPVFGHATGQRLKGSLDIAGVCTSFQPNLSTADFRQIVHDYDRDTRTIEFTIYEQPGPPPAAPDEVEMQPGERLYFWVHLYESAPQRPNLVIEAP